mgnify:CR=1 FL=1
MVYIYLQLQIIGIILSRNLLFGKAIRTLRTGYLGKNRDPFLKENLNIYIQCKNIVKISNFEVHLKKLNGLNIIP